MLEKITPSLFCDGSPSAELIALAQQFSLSLVTSEPSLPYLVLIEEKLCLVEPRAKYKPIVVDFLAGKNRHREQFGGGKNQLICKAVGISKNYKPSVLDMTAGLGGDAFVLAALGCNVAMQERNPMVAALLNDGVQRLKASGSDISLALLHTDSLQSSTSISADVVYLDPMYPDTKNKAAANKEMTVFKDIVGKDTDAAGLFERAKSVATYRVVVKRPKKGELLGGVEPTYQQMGKSSRYDIYVNKGLPKG